MTNPQVKHVPLDHTRREAPRDASMVGPTSPQQVITVSVIVRRKKPLRLHTLQAHLSRQELQEKHGADPDDVERLRQFAGLTGLAVDEAASSLARRTVVLRGTAQALQQAFRVALQDYAGASGERFHGFVGVASVPEDLEPVIEAVLGLDDRPIAKPIVRRAPVAPQLDASSSSYFPNSVASMYSFPAGNGTGQAVGIIELGGGYYASDITTYFGELGITPPTVVAVSVDGATNSPGNSTNADDEVALDVQVIGAVAPGVRIAVYFAPNSEQGFVDAINAAANDATNDPSAISISWGGLEMDWSLGGRTALDAACQSAGALGITVTAASGDHGATNGETSNTVLFPASSPHVLACGGTRITSAAGAITGETVWNDGASGGATGGGVSAAFGVPQWQEGISATPVGGTATALTGRGVPDVSGNASPSSGYDILVNGQSAVVGGTSAVAPLWAGLIAVRNQLKGSRAGFVNPILYSNASTFRDITQGNNEVADSGYQATSGWDACTGLGSPYGVGIANALGISNASAGDPTVGYLKVSNDGGFVIDIHALYKSPTAITWNEAANKDNFPIDQSRTMDLSKKCDGISQGDFVMCKVWVEAGDDNTSSQMFTYASGGPTQDFKISGGTLNNSLQYLGPDK